MADYISYRCISEKIKQGAFLICVLTFISCQANSGADGASKNPKLADEIAVLNWSDLESNFESITSKPHVRTSNTSWLDVNGNTIASHTASYQINPKATGQKYLLLHADSTSFLDDFAWPKKREGLRWINTNPYAEIRLDSSIFKSPKVIEKYDFAKLDEGGEVSLRITGRESQDVVLDDIEIGTASLSSDIQSVSYVRHQRGALFKEKSSVSIQLDNDELAAVPITWSVDSFVDPILVDAMRVRTEVSYRRLSEDPED